MRVGIVRTDLGKGIYIADVESRVQRCFSHEPPGQSRTVRRPTDYELLAVLNDYPVPLSLTGTDVTANVDTSTKFTLRIRAFPGDAFTAINVTSNLFPVPGTTKVTIRNDLNAAFVANSLPFVASIVAVNRLRITTTITGPTAYLEVDTNVASTLNDIVGFAAGGVVVAGASYATLLAAVKAAVYPTAVTINVAQATIIGSNAGFALLSAPDQTDFVLAVADLVAPQFVETPMAVMSFAKGVISKMRVAAFKPDGLVAGIGAAVVENDGVTVMSFPP
jgi:hypothetical protein